MMTPEVNILFGGLLLLVAFLYASVGHGGASGYLALMALFSFAPEVMRPTALVLNIFVASISFFSYYKGGHFSWKTFWPLALAAVPAAYLGGLMAAPDSLYKQILGAVLLLPAIRFLLPLETTPVQARQLQIPGALLMGAGIGALSGMIGIGGGIILSPLLILLGWANVKQAAAVSALFIVVNSVAGLIGQLQRGVHFSGEMALMVLIAIIGGLAGSWAGAFKFPQKALKISLAVVLLIASLKLLFT
ncbi:MAG: sulfite exporter TauE/SafE family protein [Chitinophagales bacterium]|nr:sulfite exporter TauE/SafE family protein [Chitinophagales bacterium]